MPSLITKNIDLAECCAPCKPTEEVRYGVVDTPIAEAKVENILRLHFQGYDVEDIAAKHTEVRCPIPTPRSVSLMAA